MSKSRGPVRKLMDKQKALSSTFANGSFKRWSNASVGTNEASGRWFDGCDYDAKREQDWKLDREDGINRPRPKRHNPQVVAGEIHTTIPENAAPPIDHRDGGKRLDNSRNAALELQQIYNDYVSVYDKCGTVRKRTRNYRKKSVVFCGVNELHQPRVGKTPLVERIMRGE